MTETRSRLCRKPDLLTAILSTPPLTRSPDTPSPRSLSTRRPARRDQTTQNVLQRLGGKWKELPQAIQRHARGPGLGDSESKAVGLGGFLGASEPGGEGLHGVIYDPMVVFKVGQRRTGVRRRKGCSLRSPPGRPVSRRPWTGRPAGRAQPLQEPVANVEGKQGLSSQISVRRTSRIPSVIDHGRTGRHDVLGGRCTCDGAAAAQNISTARLAVDNALLAPRRPSRACRSGASNN